MAVGDQDRVVLTRTSIEGLDRPTVPPRATPWLAGGDLGTEGDALVQAVVPSEAFQICPHLIPAGIDRIVGRHRIAGEARDITRRDQVQRVVVSVPVSTDTVGALGPAAQPCRPRPLR